ncbi:hypothetical protein [Allohahella marinimesophila]|uniref:Uncharacterized protein n=1 Tax=Allohahella marinimesophila TaxID=1054972 RepID=A0ABP7PVV5_9GAMM
MEYLTKQQKIGFYQFYLKPYGLWILGMAVAGVAVSRHFQLPPWMGWSVFIFGSVVPYFFMIDFLMKQAEKRLKSNKSKLFSKINNVDYYYLSHYGGIAISVSDNMLASLYEEGSKKSVVKVFSASKIRGYFTHMKDLVELVDEKGRVSQNSNTVMQNIRARKGSGLYIELDDVVLPEVFVQMTDNAARKWGLIIEKLKDETLEGRSVPMAYPPVE